MKATAVAEATVSQRTSRLRQYYLLSKPRVTLLVWITTCAGLLAGALVSGASVSPLIVFHALVGSWFVIASANALNQALEHREDGQMARTANRPVPAGRVSYDEAVAVGVLWGVIGVLQLAFFVNLLTAFLGALSIALYVGAYTPLKKVTPLCTGIGAIPGAIPPLAGYTAATGEITPLAFLLFLVQFFWQFPHFWAIAWLNRADYAKAGFLMLPVRNNPERSTGLLAFVYSVALIPVAAMPALYLNRPVLYLIGAILLSAWFASKAYRFAKQPDQSTAKKTLLASVAFLPVWLILLILGAA